MIRFAKGSKRLIQGIIGNLIRNKWSHNELIVGSNSLVDYYSFVTEDPPSVEVNRHPLYA